jgi:hypothetical protein
MGIESQVKGAVKSKWFYLALGILAGGTVLAYPVAKLVGAVRAKFNSIRGKSPAETAAGVAKG